MNKKVTDTRSKSKIDDKEDLEIKKVAHSKSNISTILLIILLALFTLTSFCTLFFIGKYYYGNGYNLKDNAEVIEVNNLKNKTFITNNGPFERVVDDTTAEDLNIESYASAEINTRADSKNDGKLKFDVKYIINKNEFTYNAISSVNSEVLVRFSYSFDNENWEYIDNVISTPMSTLDQIMSHYYDVGGVVGEVLVATNYEITSKPGETKKIYWKSETLIRNRESTVGKVYNANFKIEYKENA